ncbi:hypothetical protein ONS95_009021 [Cadophora gregata]|uniref:uncharacterized protein n=1 Tax=Cadophora gregata TaxID=51156 RepID=UPI0026DCE2CA|nr:uncharacterized protein ONS95_009021 [Cadophora gregata]KAK0124035.1 hypothetical protein ONS95_009021 [Cadophora gregata]KAK0130367.1 hypothetical protein ONS96_000889 [Cadophora gregata f. sp. sojae]
MLGSSFGFADLISGSRSPTYNYLLTMMPLSTAVCFILVSLAAADKSNAIEARQLKEDLSFCYGQGAYCGSALDLWDQCSDLQKNAKDLNPWYECICANGYLSTKIACNWCQAAFNISYTVGLTEDDTEACQSQSYSIAPIPATIQASQSSLNATYTGSVPGANNANSQASTTGTSAPSETSGSGGASGSSGGAAVTAPPTPQIGISATRSTFLSTVTFNGGAAGAGAPRTSTTSATQQSATNTPSVTPTGAAHGGKNGFAAGLAIFMFAIMGLVLA